jgi:Fe-S cluster biogenesis protein NfuA
MSDNKQELLDRIEKALDQIRPALRFDGGDVNLVDVEDGIVKLHMVGACGGCPMSMMTLKMGIERTIKQQIPEIRAVEAV